MQMFKPGLVFIVLLLTACGDFSLLERQSGESQDADYQLANGTVTEAHPEIVLIYIGGASPTACTGTFIGGNTVLTAAHCLKSQKASDYYVFEGNVLAGAKSIKLSLGTKVKAVFGDFALGQKATLVEAESVRDLAILVTEGFPAESFLKLATQVPGNGTSVVSVGYGLTEKNTLDYTKRQGTMKINTPREANAQYKNSLVYTLANNNETYNLPGDSGGPKIYNGTVIAVASTGGKLGTQNLGINTRVTSAAMSGLLASAVNAGALIGKTAEDEAAVKKKAEEEAAAKKKAEEDAAAAAAKKKAETEAAAAAAKKKAEAEAAAAKKKAEEEAARILAEQEAKACKPDPAFYNVGNQYDVNNDGTVTPLDALQVINALSRLSEDGSVEPFRLLGKYDGGKFVDTNNDGCLEEADALRVINYLNRR